MLHQVQKYYQVYDVPTVISAYAKQYVTHASVHETLNDFADQVAIDLQMPEAKRLVKREIKKQEREQCL